MKTTTQAQLYVPKQSAYIPKRGDVIRLKTSLIDLLILVTSPAGAQDVGGVVIHVFDTYPCSPYVVGEYSSYWCPDFIQQFVGGVNLLSESESDA